MKFNEQFLALLTEHELLCVLVALNDKIDSYTEGNGRVGNATLRKEYTKVRDLMRGFYHSNQQPGKVPLNLALLSKQAE